MKKRIITILIPAMTVVVLLAAGAAQAQVSRSPLEMTASLDEVAVGEPLTFTITKNNDIPSAVDYIVRDFLPEGMELVSATSSQGDCALKSRAELGIPPNPQAGGDSDIVQCELGTMQPGDTAVMDITVIPTVAGEVTNYAADTAENEASATVVVI